jgi:hypothetical protein
VTIDITEMSYRQLQIELSSLKKAGYTDIKLNSSRLDLTQELVRCFLKKSRETLAVEIVETSPPPIPQEDELQEILDIPEIKALDGTSKQLIERLHFNTTVEDWYDLRDFLGLDGNTLMRSKESINKVGTSLSRPDGLIAHAKTSKNTIGLTLNREHLDYLLDRAKGLPDPNEKQLQQELKNEYLDDCLGRIADRYDTDRYDDRPTPEKVKAWELEKRELEKRELEKRDCGLESDDELTAQVQLLDWLLEQNRLDEKKKASDTIGVNSKTLVGKELTAPDERTKLFVKENKKIPGGRQITIVCDTSADILKVQCHTYPSKARYNKSGLETRVSYTDDRSKREPWFRIVELCEPKNAWIAIESLIEKTYGFHFEMPDLKMLKVY